MLITRDLVEHIATLSTNSSGWSKELNLVKWNKGEPVYDIRAWSPDRERTGKGVTLTQEEVDIMLVALAGRSGG